MPIRKDAEGRWHVDLCVRRRRLHRRLPEGTTAGGAKAVEAELKASLSRSKQVVIAGDPPIFELLTDYVGIHAKRLGSPDTAKHHAARVGTLCEPYRASEARQCAARIIDELTGKYEAATINRSLGTVKRALKIAWERGRTREDFSAHVKRLQEINARDVYLTPDQVESIARHASDNVRAAIWIALLTGARRGEICKIRAEDIGADSILLRAGNTKTNRTRSIPIVPALRPWLKYLPLPINYEGVKTGFRRARVKAELPGVHFHDLRHSCAAMLIKLGVDLYTVSKILGHTTVKTTERYAHLELEAQREALKRLGNYTARYAGKGRRRPASA